MLVNSIILIIFILIYLFILFYSAMEKVFMENKILENGGRLRKNPYLLVPNYYRLFYIQMQQPQIH
jgi:hypothetical protein